MSRIVSFVVLVAILLVIAALFFQVMAKFLLPIFLAVLLVVMFGPLHQWFVARCKGRHRLAAGLTTASIILIFLVPLLGILFQAASEGVDTYYRIAKEVGRLESAAPGAPGQDTKEAGKDAQAEQSEMSRLQHRLAVVVAKRIKRSGIDLTVEHIEAVEQAIVEKVKQLLTPLALSTTQYLGNLLLGLVVMIISLYYFLADGPSMIRTIMQLSPLDDKYEQQLIDQFADLTRAVVIATLLSAFVQGLLAGIGFYFAGLGSVFLLMVLSMLLSMVPFIGAAAVWVPASLWLFFDGRTLAAVLLAIYGVAVISAADNLIKPLILHGRSNLHPLLALLSVLGGVQALGPIGIFVGPMVVAFLQTLLNMLHTELESLTAAKATGA